MMIYAASPGMLAVSTNSELASALTGRYFQMMAGPGRLLIPHREDLQNLALRERTGPFQQLAVEIGDNILDSRQS